MGSRKPKKPQAVDLFAGCGGLTLGLKQAGFKVVGAVECDALAVETYRANHPEVLVRDDDIRTVTVASMMKSLGLSKGTLDLLAGCPPCQGFSRMTTLNGNRRVDDPRNDLVFEFMRFVRQLQPKAIMMENVPGLATNHRMEEMTRELERLGYRCSVRILDAAEYGVPQRRQRLILLAGRGRSIGFARRARKIRTVGDAIRRLPDAVKRDPLHKLPEKRNDKVAALIRSIPRNGGSRIDLPRELQLKCHQSFDGFKDVYGRMSWSKVAPTITSGCVNPSKGRFLHPTRNRTVTLREAALLQSFPSKYFFSLRRGKFPAAEMIGNALPPEFIRRHAKAVIRFLKRRQRSASRAK